MKRDCMREMTLVVVEPEDPTSMEWSSERSHVRYDVAGAELRPAAFLDRLRGCTWR
jgi:hypothetical protein